MTGSSRWFQRPGTENTDAVIECVLDRVGIGEVEHLVVASNTGETAVRFLDKLAGSGVKLIWVTHHAGFRGGDEIEVEAEHEAVLRAAGVPMLTTSHALSGVGRSISRKFGGATQVELVAHTLRLFGQGTKVCVEIAVMAADAGLIPTDRDVIAVGGTGRGADTAMVIRAAHMGNFFDLRVRETLCRPIGDRTNADAR
jgi:hypothetical protein